jgi:hypothetical protein
LDASSTTFCAASDQLLSDSAKISIVLCTAIYTSP